MYRNEKNTLFLLAAIALLTLLYGNTFGIHGNDTWRIADAYGHILGFMNFKDFTYFDLFEQGQKQVFDIPIYPFLIAQFSMLSHIHPFTMSALFNYFCLLTIAYNGYLFCEFAGKNQAGIVCVCLILTSPMYLHYASMPLPDIFAIALSFYAITTLMMHELRFRNSILPIAAIALAALIKSPIPFLFMAFQFYYLVMDKKVRSSYLDSLEKYSVLFTLYFVALCSAVGAEVLRTYLLGSSQYGLVNGMEWYFGSLDLRLSWMFWLMFILHICSFSLPPFLLLFLVNLALAKKKSSDTSHLRYAYAAFLSYLTVYLIFAQLLNRHLYYSLPAAVLFFVSFAISFSQHYSAKAIKDYNNPSNIKLYGALLPFAVLLVWFTNISDKHTEFNELREMRIALANETVFLHVSNVPQPDPAMGGLLETKYQRVTPKVFETSCQQYIEKYSAIFLDKESSCFNENRRNSANSSYQKINSSKGSLLLRQTTRLSPTRGY